MAVYLTGAGADFSGFSNIFATAGLDTYRGAGGSVYREKLADGAGHGELVFNFGNGATVKYAHLPPFLPPYSDALQGASLKLQQAARVQLTTNTTVGDVFIDTGCTLYLSGWTLKVKSSKHSLSGTVDYSSGGQIVWLAPGTILTIR